jgi:flagellar hook-basal body complex protein FliE
MATFYKQNEAGEYVEADTDVDELFRSKSDEIIRKKLGKARETATAEIRAEIEEDVRKNAIETLKAEAKAEIETEYRDKLTASEQKVHELDAALRRKTIAAEYGFKPEAEQFLGDGSEDDMRAKADTLKNSFGGAAGIPAIDKTEGDTVSKLQRETGIRVEI